MVISERERITTFGQTAIEKVNSMYNFPIPVNYVNMNV